MNLAPEFAGLLRTLLVARAVGSLATLQGARPFVSMVPFAALPVGDRLRLVLHVSGLASHTRDMRSEPEVCLMIMAADSPGVLPQALPRVSISGRAEFITPDDPDHAATKAGYLAKFPDAAELFLLGDFSLVAIDAASARLIAGFARAVTLPAETLAAVLRADPRTSA